MSFYDRYCLLCQQRGLSPSAAAEQAGLSKSTVTKWKHDPDARPAGKAIALLTALFGISASELLGEEPSASAFSSDPERALKLALFGGADDITPEMYQEVLSFAAFVRDRERKKRQGGA